MNVDPRAIVEARERKGWHQAELARRAGLSRAYMSMIEQGERSPSPPAVKAIAQALEVDAGELATGWNPRWPKVCPRCGYALRPA